MLRLLKYAAALISLFIYLFPTEALAQNSGYVTSSNETGFPDYGSFITSQIDSVNLSNGGLSIRIPIFSRKGRGIDLAYSFKYESKLWVVDTSVIEDPFYGYITHFTWRPDWDDGSWRYSSNLDASLPSWTEQYYECADIGYGLGSMLLKSNWTYTASDRTKHQFPARKMHLLTSHPCFEYGDPNQYKAHSQSGHIEIDITNDTPYGPYNVKLRAKDGSKPGGWGDTFTYMDANGNWCCGWEAPWSKDTLGRKVAASPYQFFDSDGVVRSLQVETQNITLSTSFPTIETGVPGCTFQQSGNISASLIKKITLPNGLSYSFFYNTWWDSGNPNAQNPYGEVTQITLPTGGYIKYKWATIAQMDWGPEPAAPNWCGADLDARVLVERRVSEDGSTEQVWQYAYAAATTVTDPLGNTEVHNFTGGRYRLETQVEFREGASTAIRRVASTWASDNGPIQIGQIGTGLWGDDTIRDSRNFRVTQRMTTLLDVSPNPVTKTETTFGDCFTYSIQGSNFTDCRENPTEIREYDYGSGVAGALVRKTTLSYLHQSNSTYLNAHFWDRVTEKKVLDAAANTKAWSQFSYDTTVITQTSGVPQHDYAGYPYTYTVRGNQTLVKRWRNTDSAWLTTTNKFNDVGNLIETLDPLSHKVTFSYADNFSDGVNRNSQAYVTQIQFDKTSGIDHIEKKQFFWFTGLVAAACGQNLSGACTNTLTPPQPDYSKFTYDALGRPVTVVMADGGQNTIAFTEPATPTPSSPIKVSVTTKISATANLVGIGTIDGLGRVKRTEQCEDGTLTCNPSIKVDTTYDALGRKLSVTNPYRTTSDQTYGITTFHYDALGRATKVIPPDGTSGSNHILTEYSGNTVTVTDQAGKKRKSETDALGRLTRVWEPNNAMSLVHITRYQYDVLDNLLCVHQKSTDPTADKACSDATVPPSWRPRVYTYNSLSQLTQAVNPESGTTAYAYDNDGNLITKTDARGITITHTYDKLHRLTGKTYSNGDPAASFIYDVSLVDGLSIQHPVGRLVKSSQGSTRNVSSFDVGGRVLTNWQCTPLNCGTGWFTLTYAYNLIGGMTSYTDGVGNTFTQQFDNSGRVTQLTSSLNDSQHPGTLASNFGYSPTGAVQYVKFGNNLYHRVDMNNRLQPCRVRLTAGTTSEVQCTSADPTGDFYQMKYAFNHGTANDGNVMSWSAYGIQNFSKSYTYDELNRLISMTWSQCNYTWSYDIWANRTAQDATGGTGPCGEHFPIINNKNQIADTGYVYDAAGNLTSEPGKTYQYDAEGRLKSLNNGCPSTLCYTYDADGRRVRKIASAVTTEYIYGAGGVVAEKVGTTWTVGYVYLGGQLLAQYKNNTTYFTHKDHLGSTRALTTVSGSLHEQYDYLPYGEGPAGSGTTNHLFTGKERDAESGMDYYGARYYVSLAGRFLTPDLPFVDQQPGNPQTWNLYPYARNNPMLFIDPTGYAAVSIDGFTFPNDWRLGLGTEYLESEAEQRRRMRRQRQPQVLIVCLIFCVEIPVQPVQQFPTGEQIRAGNYISVTVRGLLPHKTAHIPKHHRIGIPVQEDGVWKMYYFEILGDPGGAENQQVRRNDPRADDVPFHGVLIAVTPEQKQALLQRLNYYAKTENYDKCPVCGPKYVRRSNNSNTFVFNMLDQNPAGRIKPPNLPGWSPGYKKSDDKYY